MPADSPTRPHTPPRLTAQTVRWVHALGLGPLYVRRSVVQQAQTPAPPPAPGVAADPAVAAPAPAPAPATPRRAAPSAAEGADARAAFIARLQWDEFDAAAQACRACKLGSTRQQAVVGCGSTRAQWMIVGEAPGAEEDRQGQPFVGAAGQLLDAMLHAIGLDRAAQDPQHAVFIANVLKCRPPGNRNPAPDEVAQCLPFLQRQIALLQPRLILALGRFAAQSLLGSNAPISQLRGQVHHYAGIPVVVSYHPAYLLRNPVDKARVWRDLCFARNTVESFPETR